MTKLKKMWLSTSGGTATVACDVNPEAQLIQIGFRPGYWFPESDVDALFELVDKLQDGSLIVGGGRVTQARAVLNLLLSATNKLRGE